MHIHNTFSSFFSLPPRCLEVWCCGSETKACWHCLPPPLPYSPSPHPLLPPAPPQTCSTHADNYALLLSLLLLEGEKFFPRRFSSSLTSTRHGGKRKKVQQVYWLKCEWEVTRYLNVECGGGGIVIYRNSSYVWFVYLFPRPKRETAPRPTSGEMLLQTSLVSLLLRTYADDYWLADSKF